MKLLLSFVYTCLPSMPLMLPNPPKQPLLQVASGASKQSTIESLESRMLPQASLAAKKMHRLTAPMVITTRQSTSPSIQRSSATRRCWVFSGTRTASQMDVVGIPTLAVATAPPSSIEAPSNSTPLSVCKRNYRKTSIRPLPQRSCRLLNSGPQKMTIKTSQNVTQHTHTSYASARQASEKRWSNKTLLIDCPPQARGLAGRDDLRKKKRYKSDRTNLYATPPAPIGIKKRGS